MACMPGFCSLLLLMLLVQCFTQSSSVKQQAVKWLVWCSCDQRHSSNEWFTTDWIIVRHLPSGTQHH